MGDDVPAGDEMHPVFFANAAEFMAWLETHHEQKRELWVGFHKKGAGRQGMSYPESVDAVLCFGWIDGIRKSIDAERYKNRFTPRRKGSNWSAVNIRRIQELTAEGRVRPAGQTAFEAATGAKPADYSYEQGQGSELGEEFEARFRAHPAAWNFFQSSAPWYRNAAVWWVVGAKKDETRRRRLETLIADSAAERRIAPLARRRASA